MKKDSKKYLLEHSKAKVTLLEKYLQKYLNIIVNDGYTKKIFLFDLFCGEGLYANKGEGSPLVMLKVIKNLYYVNKSQNKRVCPIDIVLNDEDSNKIKKIEKVISERKIIVDEVTKIKYRNKKYNEILPSVKEFVKNLKNHKAFIFIDPYGYRDIRASDIKDLLLNKRTEVLLFLPTQFMYRFDEKGTPQALTELLEELVDYKNWKSSSSGFSFIHQLTEALRKYLGNQYFVDTFTIQKDPNTVFCLFFFSSHIRGFEKMLETKWELDNEEGRGFTFNKTGNLFSGEKFNELETKILNFLKTYKSNSEIYYFTLSNGFLPKHVNEILKKLENDKKIKSELPKRKNAFYISYDNYSENPNKIKIKVI